MEVASGERSVEYSRDLAREYCESMPEQLMRECYNADRATAGQ